MQNLDRWMEEQYGGALPEELMAMPPSMGLSMGAPQPPSPMQAAGAPGQQADPYAAIRNLQFNRLYSGQVGSGDIYANINTTDENEARMYGQDAFDSFQKSWDTDWDSLKSAGFESKYNSAKDLGDGRIGVTFQQPGAHKYDTMEAVYGKGADGRWALQNDPMTAKSRQVSGMQQMLHDPVDIAAKFGGTAAAMYFGAGALNGAMGAGAAGTGAATGAGAAEGLTLAANTGAYGSAGALGSPGLLTGGGIGAVGVTSAPTFASVAGGYGGLGAIGAGTAAAGLEAAAAGAGGSPSPLQQLPAEVGAEAAAGSAAPEAFRPSQSYGEGMSGNQTGTYDGIINATGSPGLANAGATATGGLEALGELTGPALSWVRQNPQLARLIAASAGGLLGATQGGGGGGGGGGGNTFTGEPMQWTSGLQMGIQPGAQQFQPSINNPAAVQPRQAFGAGRFFNGG